MAAKKLTKRKGTFRPTCKGNRFAVGNKGGRPRDWDEQAIAAETIALREWADDSANYFMTSFLITRGLCPEHLTRFARYSEEFREALERAKLVQECRLVHMGIIRAGDPGFIKFILQNKAGWKETSKIGKSTGNPLTVLIGRIVQSDFLTD